MRFLLLFFTLFFAAPIAAKEPVLGLPIDCILGETCYVQHYVDRDEGPGVSDFSCGSLSYDGHKGTDIALPNIDVMQEGVDVLAAASGTVIATRNHMPDIKYGSLGAPDVDTDGTECGNGIKIRHNDGWTTMYCHMKQGSIIVEKGQSVAKGNVLGQVGLSGKTQFPHVHLAVRKNDRIVDPFDVSDTLTCNNPDRNSLWHKPLPYVASGIIQLGFDSKIPNYADIKADGNPLPFLAVNAPALVLWGHAFGGLPNDTIVLNITGPNGVFSHQKIRLGKKQVQYFRASGKRNKGTDWVKGRYRGTVKIMRGSNIIAERKTSIEVK
ncbi:MAG TPA: peptidase M24 [Rhodobacteraceae bacterium]|jgi:hypothetical protein|nr:peptidase M24 [Paracoccaceae bacterium]